MSAATQRVRVSKQSIIYNAASAVAKQSAIAIQQHTIALDTQTNTFNGIEKEFIIFTQTLVLDSITVEDIKKLQELLKPLLNNIILRNDPKSFTIKPAKLDYESMPSETHIEHEVYNIFKIPADRDKLDKHKYGKFLIFMITESLKINKEFANANDTNDTNNVDILTVHLMDHITTEDNNAIQELKKKYETLYPKLKMEAKSTPLQAYFPDFYKDIINKQNKKKLYEDTEKQYGFGDITTQDDKGFIGNLKKRIGGLQKCSTDPKEKAKNVDKPDESFYNEEYEKENSILQKVWTPTPNNPTEAKAKIEELCTNIKWGKKQFYYHKNQKFTNEPREFTKFHEFIIGTPGELEFVKTFLPVDCFNQDGTLKDIDTLKHILIDIATNSDRSNIHKQYIFGIGNDVEVFSKMKQFYNIYSMNSSYTLLKNKDTDEPYNKSMHYNCHPLVNWTIFLNMLYAKCATYNTKIPFPIRFILPGSYIPYIIDPEDIYSKYTLSATTENTIFYDTYPIIFDIDTNNEISLEFIGFLNIKYIINNTKGQNTYNNKRFFICKHTKTKIKTQSKDRILGIIPPYIILSPWFQYINNYALTPRLAITYQEIKDFIKYARQGKIFIYLYKAHVYLDDLKKQKNPLYKKILFIRQTKLSDGDEQKYNVILLTPDTYLLQLWSKPPDKDTIRMKLSAESGEYYETFTTTPAYQTHQGGNKSLVNNINIKKSTHIDLYDDKLSNGIFKTYYKLRYLLYKINKTNKQFEQIKLKRKHLTNAICILYKYILVSDNEILLGIPYKFENLNKYLITKYTPILYRYFFYNEIFIEFNIFKNINKNDNILSIGSYHNNNIIAPIEFLKYNNYKINNIKCIICDVTYFINNAQQDNIKLYLEHLKNIYDINLIYFTDKIENLLNIDLQNVNNYTLIIYNMYNTHNHFFIYSDFYNVINMFIGMMMCLKYTKINGICIINLGSVAYKQSADIYLILKEYFEESYLYYPELSNLIKDNIVFGIFKDFKGIQQSEYDKLMDILFELLKLYPDNMHQSFNIYDKDDREYFNITKPIDENESKRSPYITGFLPNNTDYTEIIEFNNLLYQRKLMFLQKITNILQDKDETYKSIKLPTKDQILSSIIYCRKYDIPIFDKLNITKQNTIITENILSDLYGFKKPILFKFITPYQTHIVNKIIFNPKFKYIKSKKTSKTNKYSSSVSTSLLTNKRIYNLTYKFNKKNLYKQTSTSFLNNSFITKKHTKKQIKNHIKTHITKSSKNISISSNVLKYSKITLVDALFQSNNALIQVERLIDVRKDYTKENPSEIYDKLKNELHYYKNESPHINKSKYSNVNYLCVKVQQLISDNNITLDWIKMYEIIIKCNLIPINRKGIFKSLHIGDTSGSFINCINNYIHNKTSYNAFEWTSQFLKPKGEFSKDFITKYTSNSNMYKLINQHRESWDWGIDDTGDITNIENIKYYAKIAKQMDINLMTSDNILPQNDPKALQVAYASYVAILYALPINGTLLYKILSPIDIPLMWNLIYITYTNFKEMYFFKPVQNSRSREFYIIAKGYLGINQTILDKLLNLVKKVNNDKSTSTKKHNNTNDDDDDYNANTDDNAVNNDDYDDDDGEFNKETYDLFNDTYPEEFVTEVQNICEHLSSNYVESIERIIYYVDNIDNLGDEYKKHIKSYITEKNDEWISEYKPEQLYKKFIL